MKYIGIFVFCIAVTLFSREYISYMRKRFSELCAFEEFFSHIKHELVTFAKPINKILQDFSSDILSKAGFLDALSSGKTLSEAYSEIEGRLSLSEKERKMLSGFFSSFGTGYLDESVRQVSLAYEEIGEYSGAFEKEYGKNVKLATTLSVTVTVGFIICFI